jgi:hypothetical protein
MELLHVAEKVCDLFKEYERDMVAEELREIVGELEIV